MSLYRNIEAKEMLEKTKRALDNRLCSAYNYGYQNGYKQAVNDVTHKMMAKIVAEIQLEKNGGSDNG